jgi:hypothetical protein
MRKQEKQQVLQSLVIYQAEQQVDHGVSCEIMKFYHTLNQETSYYIYAIQQSPLFLKIVNSMLVLYQLGLHSFEHTLKTINGTLVLHQLGLHSFACTL